MFPIMRCYWQQQNLAGGATAQADSKEQNVVNQSFEKRPFYSGMKWEWSSKN